MLEREQSRTGMRKYQVFISSTFKDLAEERKKAVEVIVSRGHIPIDLGLFSARSRSDLEVIAQAIRNCQLYVVILGHRYGSMVDDSALFDMLRDEDVPPDTRMSYTEFEYRLAESRSLMILPFILEQDEIEKRRAKLKSSIAADEAEMENYHLLKAFHERVHRSRFLRPFRPDEEFKVQVLASLEDAICECTEPGWIPEPKEPGQQTLIESVSRNPFILDIVGQLSGFEALDTRCTHEPEKKEAAATFFSHVYKEAVCHHHVSLFFESGSTVAFVAQEMADGLRHHMTIDDNGQPSIEISTNNVLAHQLLWLCHRIPITLFPWGPAETSYGATFGCLDEVEDRDPDYHLSPLDEDELTEIEKLKKMRFSIAKMVSPALLLGATSGLQLSENHTAEPSSVREDVGAQIDKCFGMHVGSYKNKLFKRFMYATGQPTVIFLESDKIDCPIRVGKCHFVLDNDLAWETFKERHPLALCVGCRQEDMADYVKTFMDSGFKVIRGNDFDDYSALIARNDKFVEMFEAPLGFSPPSSSLV